MIKILIVFSVIFAILMIKLTINATNVAQKLQTEQNSKLEQALKDAGV